LIVFQDGEAYDGGFTLQPGQPFRGATGFVNATNYSVPQQQPPPPPPHPNQMNGSGGDGFNAGLNVSDPRCVHGMIYINILTNIDRGVRSY
jgi:hypothetical protein